MSYRKASEVPPTESTARVLAFLLEAPNTERYAREIIQAIGSSTGTMTPMLTRLQRLGWITERLEEGDQFALKRPLRRYVKLTKDGRREAREYLGQFDQLQFNRHALSVIADQANEMELTLNTGWVLKAFLDTQTLHYDILQLGSRLNLSDKVVHAIVHQLIEAGWLAPRTEPSRPAQHGAHDSNASYGLTPVGKRAAVIYLSRFPRP